MRLTSIFSEAVRNVTGGTARWVLLSVIASLMVATSISLDVLDVISLDNEAKVFQSSGANTFVVTATGDIDGRTCDSLASDDSTHSGAITRASKDLSLPSTPDDPIPTYFVSNNFLSLVGIPSRVEAGVYLSRDMGLAYGINAGDTFSTSSGQTRAIDEFDYPNDGRRGGLGYAILIPDSSRKKFDECWASRWPFDPAVKSDLLLTVGGDASAKKADLIQLNTSHGAEFQAPEKFASRWTRYSGPIAGMLMLFVTAAVAWMRRVEFASNRHAGFDRWSQASQVILESIFWALPAALVSLSAALSISVVITSGREYAWWTGITCLTWVVCGGLVGAVSIVLTRTGERKFYRYFKGQ